MIEVRKAEERGHAQRGWLDSYHTFSFAEYQDPRFMGFRHLRVINEDRVQAREGFPTHSHRDMEIITYVIAGALEHRDSMGNGSVIRPGDVQRMSAGSGVSHSEYNHSGEELVHLLQIWVLPNRLGVPPSYEQKHFPAEVRRGVLCLVASASGRDGSLRMHQDADMYASILAPTATVRHGLRPGRAAWVQVVRGEVLVNGVPARTGDGVAISDVDEVIVEAAAPSELLLFDLA